MKKINLIILLVLLTGCNGAFTKANKDFGSTVGYEWAEYKNTVEATEVVDAFVADTNIRWNEADLFYKTVVPEYNIFIHEDTTLTSFDLRIRDRYVADYTELLYGIE